MNIINNNNSKEKIITESNKINNEEIITCSNYVNENISNLIANNSYRNNLNENNFQEIGKNTQQISEPIVYNKNIINTKIQIINENNILIDKSYSDYLEDIKELHVNLPNDKNGNAKELSIKTNKIQNTELNNDIRDNYINKGKERNFDSEIKNVKKNESLREDVKITLSENILISENDHNTKNLLNLLNKNDNLSLNPLKDTEQYKTLNDLEKQKNSEKISLLTYNNVLKMEIDRISYSSKIDNIIFDEKLKDINFSNINQTIINENLNSGTPMDLIENISNFNSNIIFKSNKQIYKSNILNNEKSEMNNNIENSFKNVANNIELTDKHNNNINKNLNLSSNEVTHKNEEIHKLNIFDVGIEDNLKDYFINDYQENRIYNVNNYLTIIFEPDANGNKNYIIELSKNIFSDDSNNNLEDDVNKKKEDKVVEKIIPNFHIKKLWDPNLITEEKRKFYIMNLIFI